MILTEYVIYRGKKKKISELSPTSGFKVKVKCPNCGEIRSTYYRVICKAGHHYCQKCIVKIKRTKKIEKGQRFGKLFVLSEGQKTGYSLCQCECGNEKEVLNYNLRTGYTKSCGCLRKENFKGIKKPNGKNHGHWKGGISDLRERDMQTKEYKDWRKAVFERDGYICKKCGQKGYELNAHHIYNYSKYADIKYDIENGVTLCQECHIEFHHLYGRENNKIQLDKYLLGREVI